MVGLIWAGVGLTTLGLAGVIWSILRVARARRRLSRDEDLRAEVKKALPINLGAFMLSILGLMMVLLGVMLD